MHIATVQQPLTMVSPNSNPTIVMLQAEAGFISKHNVVPFICPCPPFIAPLAAQTPVTSSQGVVVRDMAVRSITVVCAQSTCHHGQWCNEKGEMGPVVPSFPSASSDDRSVSQLLVFL
ncbi:uncharacterized protein TNCV_622931 [Trichonephila clavipes]|nr:uncharacterized protein TNCV_622931 [Trichonephila clavipes]